VSFRKKRPVLYEVLKRERAARSGPLLVSPASRPIESVELPPVGVAAASSHEPPDLRGDADASPGRFSIADSTIRLSVSYPVAGLVGVAALVVLMVAFHLGRRIENGRGSPAGDAAMLALLTGETASGRTSLAGDSSEQSGATGGEPAAGGLSNLPRRDSFENSAVAIPLEAPEPRSQAAAPAKSDPPPTAKPAAPTQTPAGEPRGRVVLEKGTHYVVIQHFRKKDAGAAEQAGAFLRANGIDCAIQHNKEDIRLVATTPFRIEGKEASTKRAEEVRAETLLRQIKQLGKDYSRTGGYAFDQCELKKF